MSAPDFITVLGRLLRSGTLRDEFAVDPRKFARASGLSEPDCGILVQMSPEDLETQARVLLRKRFAAVRTHLPQTYKELGAEAWRQFISYSRSRTADEQNRVIADALAFIEHLRVQGVAICPAEHNRLRFIQQGRSFALHMIVVTTRNRSRRFALQFVWRWKQARCREWHFYLAA